MAAHQYSAEQKEENQSVMSLLLANGAKTNFLC
jgi:hypothetical protein